MATKKTPISNEMDKMDEDDEEFIPPSEAELKVLAAKRERSDKISKLMGNYLLRGYKMLATTCPTCGTIELEDKSNGKIYCVACEEVDCAETAKDNPVLNPPAPPTRQTEQRNPPQTRQNEQRNPQSTTRQNEQRVPVDEPIIVPKRAYICHADPADGLIHTPTSTIEETSVRTSSNFAFLTNAASGGVASGGGVAASNKNRNNFDNSYEAVMKKMKSATSVLESTSDVDASTKLVILIRECVECAIVLKKATAAPPPTESPTFSVIN